MILRCGHMPSIRGRMYNKKLRFFALPLEMRERSPRTFTINLQLVLQRHDYQDEVNLGSHTYTAVLDGRKGSRGFWGLTELPGVSPRLVESPRNGSSKSYECIRN